MIQIVMFVFGVIALVRGEVKFSKRSVVQGKPARLIGIIFVSVFPVAILLGFVTGFLMSMNGVAIEGFSGSLMLVDIGITIAAGISGFMIAKKYGFDPTEEQAPLAAAANFGGESPGSEFAPPIDSSNPFRSPRS